jgi:hypothetical protein
VTANYFANQATLRYERCGSKYVTAWLKFHNFATTGIYYAASSNFMLLVSTLSNADLSKKKKCWSAQIGTGAAGRITLTVMEPWRYYNMWMQIPATMAADAIT